MFARQKELGIVPADAQLSRHDPDVPDWASLPPAAQRLAARMMDVFAGFLSHADHQSISVLGRRGGLGGAERPPGPAGSRRRGGGVRHRPGPLPR